MNHYANDEQRVRLIAGLRDLAVFLDQNPDVPAPSRADRYGSLGGGGQQMPVHLVSNVDVPMPEEVSKLGDLHATREHRGSEGVP